MRVIFFIKDRTFSAEFKVQGAEFLCEVQSTKKRIFALCTLHAELILLPER